MSSPLNPALAAFLTSHISIHLAATGANGMVTLVRGLGCRIAAEAPTRVRLLTSRPQAEPVLRAIEETGRIAAVFNEPESHRTVQLKGIDARLESVETADQAIHRPYVDEMSRRLKAFATPEPLVRTLLACAPGEFAVVSFTPQELFGQTPGPQAGARLPAGTGAP